MRLREDLSHLLGNGSSLYSNFMKFHKESIFVVCFSIGVAIHKGDIRDVLDLCAMGRSRLSAHKGIKFILKFHGFSELIQICCMFLQ